MATTTVIPFNNTIISGSKTVQKLLFFKPNTFTPPHTNLFSCCKLVTHHQRAVLVPKISKFHSSNSDYNDADSTSSEPQLDITSNSKETTIDIQLPRRSLLLQFTCNACGERTERLINRLAYEQGAVFVQCSGCLKHHKIVDNLDLVVEYNFREDKNTELND